MGLFRRILQFIRHPVRQLADVSGSLFKEKLTWWKEPKTIAILSSALFISILAGFILRNQIATFFSNPGAAPVAYWKFDEGQGATAFDSAGSNDGTLTGNSAPMWVSEDQCVSGKCLYFDGTNDLVQLGSTTALSLNDSFTLSAWIRPATISPSNPMTIMGKGNSVFRNYDLYVGTNGKLLFNMEGMGLVGNTIPSTNTLTINRWQYVSATFDNNSNTVSLYINGLLEKTASTNTNNPGNSTAGFAIGCQGTGGCISTAVYFAGYIDEPKIYNYARSAAQIQADYASRGSTKGVSAQFGDDDMSRRLSDGLVGYWNMDAGTGTSVADLSGNNNTGNFGSGTAAPTWSSGKFGNGLNFDGTGDHIQVAHNTSIELNNEFTISTWVKTTATNGALVSKGGFIAVGGTESSVSINVLGGVILGMFRDWSYSIANAPQTSKNISDNEWHHIVLTNSAQANISRLYVDGIIEDTAIGFSHANTSTGDLYFGALQYNLALTNQLQGQQDEVRIYNRALAPDEVRALYEYAPGPIGWWKMDEGSWNGTTGEVIDSSGNGLNGTRSGNATTTVGKMGKAGSFDGSSDYITVGDLEALEPANEVTMSLWAKTNDYTKSTNGGIAKGSIFGNGLQYSYKLNFSNGTASGSVAVSDTHTALTTYSIGDNNWHHWVYTYNGSEGVLYKDGVAVDRVAGSGAIDYDQPNNIFMIGARSNGTFSFDGLMDEVKIYNYARTQAQIVQDMNAGHPAPGSPVGSALLHFKLDEGYGSTVNNVGNVGSTLNGTLASGSSSPSWINNGKFDKALSFDGNDYVDFGDNDSLKLTFPFTLSSWINISELPVDEYTIISKWYSFSSDREWALQIISDNRVRFGKSETGANSEYVYADTSFSAADIGKWNHIMLTADENGNYTFYRNGKANGSGTFTNTTIFNDSASAMIGAVHYSSSLPGRFFKGSIDEVKVYNLSFTADQAKVEYNQGKAIVLGAGSTGVGGTSPSNSSSRAYCIPGDNSTCEPPVGEWLLDEGSGTSAYSTSGTANGIMSNFSGRYGWTQGKVGGGILFDGTDDRIEINSSGPIGTDSTFSISAWVKPVVNYSTNGAVYCECNINGATRNFFMVLSNGKISLDQYEPAGGSMDSNAAIPFGQWSHIAYARNGSTQYLYINGVLDNSNTSVENFSGAVLGQPTKTMIGARFDNSGDNYSLEFNGVIDQVRAYNYYRTPAQIAWEYGQGSPVAWYRFDECTGTTAYNAVKNANGQAAGINGTITIGASGSQTSAGTCSSGNSAHAWNNGTSGRFNSSLNFDGTDDVVTITESPAIDVGAAQDSYSIAAWFKTSVTPGAAGGSIVAKHDGSGVYPYRIYMNNTNQIVFIIFDGLDFPMITSTGTYTDNKWHYVVGIRDTQSDLLSLYIDGSLIGTTTDTTTASIANDDAVSIGNACSSYTTCRFIGQIDEVKLFNYPLTRDQIRVEMSGGAVRFE